MLLTAALSSLLYFRGRELLMVYTNAPGRLPEINTFSHHEIKFADRVRSCEDVLVLESRGVALLACDAGRERWNTVMVRRRAFTKASSSSLLPHFCLAPPAQP